MADVTLDLTQPIPMVEDENEETLVAIDRGMEAADEGRTVALEEVRKMIPAWVSKFKSQSRR